jgi:hypothetical protein
LTKRLLWDAKQRILKENMSILTSPGLENQYKIMMEGKNLKEGLRAFIEVWNYLPSTECADCKVSQKKREPQWVDPEAWGKAKL